MIRYRWIWSSGLMLLPLLAVLFVACSSDDEEASPMLSIYVYAPERPTVTRAEIVPTNDEARVYNLQIWVFRSSDPSKMVASLTLKTEEELQALNNDKGATYSVAITDHSFARYPEPVDIYVLANVLDNNGTNVLEYINSSTDLDEACFNGGHFFNFMKSPEYQAVTTIPEGKGVPMSGVARGRSVVDKNSVFHINDANLKLVRDVSKIRFVFSSLDGEDLLYIDGVTLDNNMLYKKEHFFLDDAHPYYWVEDPFTLSGDKQVQLVKGDLINPVKHVQGVDPIAYAITSEMSDEEYETKINEGISEGKLTQFPVVYLPESDKKLTGTIWYRLSSDTSPAGRKSAKFSMIAGDFRRNQTWIVYSYYIGSSKLEINTVKVTNWKDETPQDPHELHNL